MTRPALHKKEIRDESVTTHFSHLPDCCGYHVVNQHLPSLVVWTAGPRSNGGQLVLLNIPNGVPFQGGTERLKMTKRLSYISIAISAVTLVLIVINFSVMG